MYPVSETVGTCLLAISPAMRARAGVGQGGHGSITHQHIYGLVRELGLAKLSCDIHKYIREPCLGCGTNQPSLLHMLTCTRIGVGAGLMGVNGDHPN